MQRAIITAKGKVQRAGYRDYVFDLAVELGVVGYVENQLDGTVLIVGEAEKDILEDFIRKLKPEDDPLVMVGKIDTRYEKATLQFKHFEIKRGTSDEESGERLDTAGKSLKILIKTVAGMNDNLGGKIDNVAEKQDKMLEKQDQMLDKQNQTIERLDAFHQDTVQKFDNLDVKYGRIADNMEKILKEMKEERKDFRESIEKILKILISQKSKS